uniref:Sex comb on midleg-like1 n=1 Tax=Phallusia mammillata TaxID=59560 RepID=A0A6F9DR23_9ASCI|nr:Sex comb on midleg-like1 [Phallusia mammillata]
MSRRTSNDSTKSASSSGIPVNSRKGGKAKNESTEFVWDKYLQQTGMPAAPQECFKHDPIDQPLENTFEMFQKMEAKDARNPSAISVATIVMIEGPRLCLRLDGTDSCNDFWRLVNSKDIFPMGTCEAHGGLLQPPLGFTRNVSTWPAFLQKTLQSGKHANSDSFLPEPEGPKTNLFKVGMKLEAVDLKNPQLICPATIGEVDGEQIFVSFDGWRGAFDYWCNFDSRDIYPVGWCHINNHPIQPPGKKGDNPMVAEKLKAVVEDSKRQTRSVKNNPDIKHNVTKVEVVPPSIEKPARRRTLEKIARTKQAKEEKQNKERKSPSPPLPGADHVTSNAGSDWSMSSDESDSSQDSDEPKHKGESDKDSATGKDPHDVKMSSPSVDQADTESPSSDQSSSKDGSVKLQITKEDRRRKERKAWKQRKKQRRLAKALKRAGRLVEEGELRVLGEGGAGVNFTPEQIALLTSSQRKRHLEGECFKLKKKKKKKRMCDASYTRMEGFGIKGDITPTATTGKSPTSPSFLDAPTSTPTSLFGCNKAQIVRSATEGWPTRLQMGSVVTSDNKLGKFDTSYSTFSKSTVSDQPLTPTKSPRDPITMAQCVSTTTSDAEQPTKPALPNTNEKSTTPPPSVSSTSQIAPPAVEPSNSEDSNAVSSTTNPPPPVETPPPTNSDEAGPPSKVTSSELVTSSLPATKRRSRNPSKWTIDDVIVFVGEKEPALHSYLHLFQKHEIDGAAFLLLNSNNIVKYMNLKLGPALKLCTLVEDLKVSIARRRKK